MSNNWEIYPESSPSEDGYYATQYYNPKSNGLFYKPLWYSVKDKIWIGPWSWSYDFIPTGIKCENGSDLCFTKHKGIDVRKYQPATRANYYTECSFIED